MRWTRNTATPHIPQPHTCILNANVESNPNTTKACKQMWFPVTFKHSCSRTSWLPTRMGEHGRGKQAFFLSVWWTIATSTKTITCSTHTHTNKYFVMRCTSPVSMETTKNGHQLKFKSFYNIIFWTLFLHLLTNNKLNVFTHAWCS